MNNNHKFSLNNMRSGKQLSFSKASANYYPSTVTVVTAADDDNNGNGDCNENLNDSDPTPKMVDVEFHDDTTGVVTGVQVPHGTKIVDAARKAGVVIPTLCHHPRLDPIGKCGICAVVVEDASMPTQLACSTFCTINTTHGSETNESVMKVHVNGHYVNGLAKTALQRSFEHSQMLQRYERHSDLATCGTLEIEELGHLVRERNIDRSSKCITFDPSLCVGCSRCYRACCKEMGVLEVPIPKKESLTGIAPPPPCVTTKGGRPLRETDCISCGQCTVFCPTGAIHEVDHISRVMRALSDPNKIVVLQTAPSARVTLGEMFGQQPGDAPPCAHRRLVGAAKMCGFDYVFDTNMAADLTIMEEASELLYRMEIAKDGTAAQKRDKPLPMFTSCCPGWINFVEQSYPKLIPHLSTCRSPMGMLSSIIRQFWWPRNIKKAFFFDPIDQSQLYVVALMPCTAKKDEMAREQLRQMNETSTCNGNNHSSSPSEPDTNAVLTVREFAQLMELRGAAMRNDWNSFESIPEADYDNPLGESSGAAAIFGVTGGVMEAALRTAADVLTGQDLPNVEYEEVRGLSGIKKSTVKLKCSTGGQISQEATKVTTQEEILLHVAVCHQMKNIREFLRQIETGEFNYHFIEIMACPGGCIGGGGLPQSNDPDVITKRIQSLYSKEERMVKRKAHENEDVKTLYAELLGSPYSVISHKILHTNYYARPRKPSLSYESTIKIRKGKKQKKKKEAKENDTAIPNNEMEQIVIHTKRTTSIPGASLTSLSEVTGSSNASSGSSGESIYVVYGTQHGTAKHAAEHIQFAIQKFLKASRHFLENPRVTLLQADAMSPEALATRINETAALGTIFVTSTFGNGGFPDMFEEFWQYLEAASESVALVDQITCFSEHSMRYAVFGLGSSMFSGGDDSLFNRAAKLLDKKLEELGCQRVLPLGLGDDLDPKTYYTALEPWLENLLPNLFDIHQGEDDSAVTKMTEGTTERKNSELESPIPNTSVYAAVSDSERSRVSIATDPSSRLSIRDSLSRLSLRSDSPIRRSRVTPSSPGRFRESGMETVKEKYERYTRGHGHHDSRFRLRFWKPSC